MRKIAFLMMLLFSVTASAKYVSVDVARKEVADFIGMVGAEHSLKSTTIGENEIALSYTLKKDRENCLYVFDVKSSGFVIASADDRVPGILGYSQNGTFDAENISDGLQFMLNLYAEQISYVKENDITAKESSTLDDWEPISPLLSTQWNQYYPYNKKCPYNSKGKQCLTGCAATAMAQIMKYHNFPPVGTGSNTYDTEIDGVMTTVSLDFSSLPFEWEKMFNKYNRFVNKTDEMDAVANLMYAAGVSANMEYGSESSGAYTKNAINGLLKNFNYDSSIRHIVTGLYSLEEYNKKMYEELSESRPVYIEGCTKEDDAHAFVCDGYDSQDYFHINWGWGGQDDGYFKLGLVDEGGMEYEYKQNIVCNIKPNRGGSFDPYCEFVYDTDFCVNQSWADISSKEWIEFFPEKNMLYVRANFFMETEVTFGVEVTEKSTGESKFIGTWKVNLDTKYDYYSRFYVNSQSFSELKGTEYYVYPAFKIESLGIQERSKVFYGCRDSISMKKYGDTLVFDNNDAVEDVWADSDSSAPVYYNLQGQVVTNPERGIFICRQGSKVTKVIK